MQTPSFIVWALAQHCSLRQISLWENPQRTERLLRAARAFDEATADGRVLDGICVAAGAEGHSDPSGALAFRASEALEVYQGLHAVRAACSGCPANALGGYRGRTIVGCFGMWPLPAGLDAFCRQVDERIADDRALAAAVPSVKETTPLWYGLWIASPHVGPAATAIANLIRQLALDDPASAAGRDELVLALDVAAAGIPLQFQLYPPGSIDGPWWNLVPHCGRCRAPWSSRGSCRVCGQAGHPASPKKRRVRGQRPYYPLTSVLGEVKAAEFWLRYRAFRDHAPDNDAAQP